MCTQTGLACGGYAKSIFFDFEEPAPGELRFRRPLLTEEERRSMSEWLTLSVPPSSALRYICQVDEEGDEAPASQELQICRGPFGAFRVGENPSISPSELVGVWSDDILSQNSERLEEEFALPSDAALSPTTQQLMYAVFDPSSHCQPLDMMDSWNVITDCGRVQEVLEDIEISMPQTQQPSMSPLATHQFSFQQVVTEDRPDIWRTLNPSTSPLTTMSIPHDAVFLLKHYSTTVLRMLTPFRHSKTPWHILFIPHVKNCLAALTLGEDVDHAGLCVFYGTLAVSAFSLGGVSCCQMWLDQGRLYKQQAREHVRLILKTAYDIPKPAKYKSILMALLTMVQLSMVSGNQDRTECYLVEAEKFIRVKGLNRKKSRKVRLLHHCYAFERLFHESTFVGGINSMHRHHVRKAIESSGAIAYSQDTLSFTLSDWKNLDEAMLKVKGREEGENDLHLQRPGVWSATLYPEIFGVPERYIFLLSITIRLGREKDDAECQTAASLKEFLGRAKAVERCIKQLRHHGRSPNFDSTYTFPQELDTILEAMQLAISIYFYRRVYDVDISMLQHQVAKVRDCLMRYESTASDSAYGSARLIWPAFIAASEAEDLEVQQSFCQWFKDSAMRSGLRFFTNALANLERIWEGRRTADGMNITWNELMA